VRNPGGSCKSIDFGFRYKPTLEFRDEFEASWRNIAITLIDRVVSETAILDSYTERLKSSTLRIRVKALLFPKNFSRDTGETAIKGLPLGGAV
jgi:hypothetical protein